jgi:hypothetical protein
MSNSREYDDDIIPLTGICTECEEHGDKATMKLSVLRTPAGYYLGFWCDNHGPYSRETNYVRTREEAEEMLQALEKRNGISTEKM